MPRQISSATTLEQLRRDAKRWLRALRSGDASARTRLADAVPESAPEPTLREVQHALAREYGYESWRALSDVVAARSTHSTNQRPLLTADAYARLASDWVQAFGDKDSAALQRLNAHYDRAFTFDDLAAEIWRRVYAFRQRASREAARYLKLEEAQILIAQDTGFSSWGALVEAVDAGTPPVPPHLVDRHENRISPRRHLNTAEWDDLIAVAQERRVAQIDAAGLANDTVLAKIARLPNVTALTLSGSRGITDAGLQTLAHMPQLQMLELNGMSISDHGLEVLRHLPNLRRFELTWNRSVSDAGLSHLRHCDQLEGVNVMGTPSGDGVLEALQGKSALKSLELGREVTDAGIPFLHRIPQFATFTGEGAHLMLDGPFTDRGVSALSGLEGIVHLDLFWHVTAMTGDGFAHLGNLPNLHSLGADGHLSTDTALRYMAALPKLRHLRAQEAVASEDGFVALSHSQTLESFWGRECPNFGDRAFLAFARLPALRSMGVGCGAVSDEALSAWPQFPALRELTPIGVRDDGFRHIGRCARLERLTCMYCRESGDAATAHVAGLALRSYYAGLTQITDRSLEMLGRMTSLEQVELYETKGVTDAGLPALARLPRLREVALDHLPNVTLQGTRVFPSRVRVRYTS